MVRLLLLLPFFLSAEGYIFNPLDVDFSRLLPEQIAAINITSHKENPDSHGFPVCTCGKHVGTPVTFWEPVMLAEVVSKPFKSLLSGVDLSSPALQKFSGGRLSSGHTYMHVHLYDFPLLSMMEDAIPNFLKEYYPNEKIERCLDKKISFKVRYLSEFDVSHTLAPFSLLLTPEIFGLTVDGSVLATAATCLADYSRVATGKKSIDSLYFCSGDRNFLFPLSGHIGHTKSNLDQALLILERAIFKQHRLSFFSGEKMGTCGKSAQCTPQPSWTPRKTQYSFQLLSPRPKRKVTINWGDKIPKQSLGFDNHHQDFVFLVWRKRYCCL